MRSERRRHGLAVAGVALATPAGKTPRYLTGGYYYKRQEQKQIQNC
ncbi:conjugal transfer protein [Clostridioides difficile]|nr:conjugal transfer protein [Clostridioides difficile]